MVGLALFAEISVKFLVKIYFRLYERRDSPPWRRKAGKFPLINALKRAGCPPRTASKSKLRTHDKVCLGQHLFG